jgi:predicted nucleic acid-binding protein
LDTSYKQEMIVRNRRRDLERRIMNSRTEPTATCRVVEGSWLGGAASKQEGHWA